MNKKAFNLNQRSFHPSSLRPHPFVPSSLPLPTIEHEEEKRGEAAAHVYQAIVDGARARGHEGLMNFVCERENDDGRERGDKPATAQFFPGRAEESARSEQG